MIDIIAERPEHRAAIAALHRVSFGGDFEAALVERLHRDGLVIASLLAIEDGDVVGHILFSALDVEVDGRRVEAAALAPMAVMPSRQGQGIGSRLARCGLDVLKRRGIEAVIVLGHESYYPRFGFSVAAARKLAAPFSGDAFMALELTPGALAGERGTVRYPAAFGLG
jgi:putative acetyltransferase